MAFFLPLNIQLSNLFLVLFFIASGYLLVVKKEYRLRPKKVLLLSLLPIFFLYIFGLFYSTPPFEGLKIIGRNISFLLCPLLLFFYRENTLDLIRKNLFNGIVAGSLLSILFLLGTNFYNYFATRPLFGFDDEIFNYYYTYYYFTEPLLQHPTYLGTYVLLSLGILMQWISSWHHTQNLWGSGPNCSFPWNPIYKFQDYFSSLHLFDYFIYFFNKPSFL